MPDDNYAMSSTVQQNCCVRIARVGTVDNECDREAALSRSPRAVNRDDFVAILFGRRNGKACRNR